MRITVGDRVLTAVLADNSSAEALKEILMAGPLTIDMSDHGNMEKVGPIGQSLPTNDEQITTGPGDIILYMGDSLVIYYDTNSWNFTRLGKIQDVTQAELKEILGGGNVTVTLSLGEERTSGEQTGTVQVADQTEGQAQGAEPGQGEKPVVYMTDPITPEGLMAVYDAMGRDMKGKVAVKLSMGEPGGHNYLSPDLIKDLVARWTVPLWTATQPTAARGPARPFISRWPRTTASRPSPLLISWTVRGPWTCLWQRGNI